MKPLYPTPSEGSTSFPFVDASARFEVPRRIARGVASSADIIHALLHADDESAVIGGLRSLVELLDAAMATDDVGARAVLVSQAAERASVVLLLARQERRDLEGGA